MKKFSLLESFKYTDGEYEDFFYEFFEKGDFELENGYVKSEKSGLRFFSDPAYVNANTRECKRIEISFDNKDKGVYDQKSSCTSMTSLDIINGVVSTIKKFYMRSNESISFSIKQKWNNIDVTFFIIGSQVQDKLLEEKDKIKSLLSELAIVLKNRGYKRIKHESTNWLEIRTPKKRVNGWDTDTLLRTIFERAINGNLQQSERNQPLIDWVRKVTDLGYNISYGGGDSQVVIQLKQ